MCHYECRTVRGEREERRGSEGGEGKEERRKGGRIILSHRSMMSHT